MINISDMTNNEIATLCPAIGYKNLKHYFQSNPRVFSRIKPGFRAESMKDVEVCTLIQKSKSNPYISGILYKYINNMRIYMQEAKKNENNDVSYAQTLAKELIHSPFAKRIDLYFRLFHDEIDPELLESVQHEVAKLNAEQDRAQEDQESAMIEGEPIPNNDEMLTLSPDEFAELIESSEAAKSAMSKMRDFRDHKHMKEIEELSIQHRAELEDQKQRYEDTLQETSADLKAATEALQVAQTELYEYHKLTKYNDSWELPKSEYQHISVCEVLPPDSTDHPRLSRLADVNPDGSIDKFFAQEDIPRYYDNRDRLFYQNGPRSLGTIAIWSWSASQSKSDPAKDYVSSQYEPHYSPIEIIALHGCASIEDVAEFLKASSIPMPACDAFVLAAHMQNGQYIGIKCSKAKFDWVADMGKLKADAFKLPVYRFSQTDILRLGNDKAYFRNLGMGIPCDILRIKEPLEIVKKLVLTENTWTVYKQRNITKREWQGFRGFIEQLKTDDLIQKITKACGCERTKAEQYLSQFINRAYESIDGRSIEDEILSVAIKADDDLLQRCKQLLREEWQQENKVKLNSAIKEQRIKEEQAVETGKQLKQLQDDYDALARKRDVIVHEIAQKEQLAVDVEETVTNRIRQAQANAAEFIANMAFAPVERSHAPVEIASAETTRYYKGEPIDTNELEINNDWSQALESIEIGLTDAGVAAKYTHALSAYLYSSFVNHSSLLLCGPNASEIADAFSAALFGEKASALVLAGVYDAEQLRACDSTERGIIKIINPFTNGWISRLPETLERTKPYCLAIHPYAEDIVMEPRSLFNYAAPLMTELLVDRTAEPITAGGCFSENFVDFTQIKNDRVAWVKALKAPLIFRSRAQTVLGFMHSLLDDASADWDILFSETPYAFATMQLSALLEELRSTENEKLRISGDLLEMLEDTYGV